jgi:hypothetical protein
MEEGRSCLASVGLGRLQKWTFIGNHGGRERERERVDGGACISEKKKIRRGRGGGGSLALMI